MQDLFHTASENRKEGTVSALCMVISTKGSTPMKSGAKMIVYPDGRIEGTIGGGNLEKGVIANALNVIKEKNPRTFNHDLMRQHGMCCGGFVTVYIEPIMPAKKLYIFGSGHVGRAIAHHTAHLDFDIFVIDPREDEMCHLKGQRGFNLMNVDYDAVLPSLPFDGNTYVVIVTYEHEIDRKILAFCLKQPHAYLGMIGSRRKVAVTKARFIKAGIATESELDTVDMPMGLDISASGPDEIAISILAAIIKQSHLSTC